MAKGPTDLAVISSRPDPLLDWMWRSDEAVPFGLRWDYVEGIDLPFNNIDISNKIHRGSGYQYYPGFHDISAITVNLYEDSQATTLKWINGWKSKVKNFDTGVYGYPVDFKRNWKFILCDAKGDKVLSCTLIGLWPADTSPLSLSYSSNARLTISQQFSVDSGALEFHR